MGGRASQLADYGKTIRAEREEEMQKWRKVMDGRRKDLSITPELEQKITNSFAFELVDLLNNAQATSRQILTVLAFRCTTVAHHFNQVTEVDFEVADRAAATCDAERKRTGKKNWTLNDEWDLEKYFPPFFGIPISIKDNIDMKGKRSTMGVTVRAHDIKEKDSGMVACVRAAGMIPFVRSNVAQMTMSAESYNLLYGRSLNVWNVDRNIGGSSGGEGGLISAFCSPIGIGTDLGGSVRVPA